MKNTNEVDINQWHALWSDFVASRMELKTKYDEMTIASVQGKIPDWQKEVNLKWVKLIAAEDALTNFINKLNANMD